jgi:two-component system, NarL family, response regulator NreC
MNVIKILLLDDHQIVRDGLKQMLAGEEDLQVIGSLDNGCEALRFVQSHRPDFVIADLSMPGMNGIEFTKKALALDPNIKVLILTMFVDEDYLISAIQAGAKGYLPKQDSTTAILLEAIRKIASGQEYYSPSVSKTLMDNYIANIKNGAASESVRKVVLTAREKEVLKLYVEGSTNSEIAEKLCISEHTVKTHKNNIMLKYNFKSPVEMIKFALRNKLVEW